MANGKMLQAVINIAGRIDPSLAKSINQANKQIGGINVTALAAGAAVAAGTVAAVKFGIEATKSAAKYEKEMSNVATLLDGDVKGRIEELQKEVLKVSNSTGVVTKDLTDGLYQVISAFGDTKDSAKTLEIASKAAKAGNATTTDSINLLSAVTKGYGDTSAKAQQKAADLAFQTVKLGQTSFPELASSIGKVIPLANAMGVAQEELFGATATLTGVTGNTAEVMTQLKGTVQGFLQPSKQMSEAIESLGYENGKALLESEGLQGALDLLMGSVKGNEIEFSNLFGSVEAKSAVLALAGSQAENFTEKTKAMYQASGIAEKAFEAQTDNLDSVLAMMKNYGSNFMTSVGLKILPIVKELAEKALPVLEKILVSLAESGFPDILIVIIDMVSGLSDLIMWISNTNGAFETIAITVGTLTALLIAYKVQQALTASGTTIWGLVAGGAATATTALGTAFAFLTSPIGLVILAIGAVIAIGVLLYKNWEQIISFASVMGERLKEIFTDIGTGISNAIKLPVNFMIDQLNRVIEGVNNIEIPDWVPAIGGKGISIPFIPKLAKGGFTEGVSIAGEAGTEAVISFDKNHRKSNIDYWRKAGEILGVLPNGQDKISSSAKLFNHEGISLSEMKGSGSVVYDFSGIKFAPQVVVHGEANKSDLMQILKEFEEEFMDFLEEKMQAREVGRYAKDSPVY
jgi:TP901 family phage tail tape measure protein